MNYYSCLAIILILIAGINDTKAQSQVVDEQGIGLPFVYIYNADNNIFLSSDTEGYFSLPAELDQETEITFSFTGYELIVRTVAEIHSTNKITLQPGLTLDEVVMVGRTDERTQDVINKIESITSKDIRSTSPQTSADALGQHAGVYVQKSQMGGGSPVIRGFEANKILLVIDGVRMNNAIYRGGHLQNAITVDPAMLERMEVIYGPGSLVYGSDALGGVVHFRSKNPKLSLSGAALSGEAYIRYSTANAEKTGHFHINYGSKKWASLTSFSMSDFDDLRMGAQRSSAYPEFGKRNLYVERINNRDSIVTNENENIQVGTAYTQYDFMQKVVYQPTDDTRVITNIQYSTSSDVPRYDALTEERAGQLRYAEWYYGPQQRFMSSVRMDHLKKNKLYDKLIMIAAYQSIDEDRIDRLYQSDKRDYMEEDLSVYSFTTDFKKVVSSWKLHYGAELTYNDLTSTATEENITTGNITRGAVTRYPSAGSSTYSASAYAFAKRKVGKASFLFGARYSKQGLNVKYDRQDIIVWPDEFYEGLSSTNASFNWSVGGQYDIAKTWKIKSQLATAFRAPNIDDLAKIRINNDEVSVPNLDLGPESSLTGEVTLGKYVGSSYLSATYFYTRLTDAIVRDDFTLPDGSPVLEDEGNLLNVVANVNADKARVWGVSVNGKYQLSERWLVQASANLINGTSIAQDGEESPLGHIPPLYGRASVGYSVEHGELQLVYRYNGKKPIAEYGGSVDNPENATPDGTPAWSTWNMYYTYPITEKVRAAFAIENILDTHYRPFASGVSGAGRNVSVTIGMKF